MMSFEKIDISIDRIKSLMASPLGSLHTEIAPQIINEYSSAFEQLFADGLDADSVQAQIAALVSKKTPDADLSAGKLNFDYIKRLVALKDHIDSLPDEFPAKKRLNTRILEHCSIAWIEKFKRGTFTESPEDFASYQAEYFKESIQSTVEVITWGTKEELGNGAYNAVRQKIAGDPMGHTSLLMRLPLNEQNRALIEKYCLHDNGSIKIPYSVKRYGNQFVYEVYWSYWPGRLNKPQDDIQAEHSAFAFTTQSDVIDKLPPELRERYIYQKQKQDWFEKRYTINLAPIAIPVVTTRVYDQLHQEFIDLKLKKYKKEEEIHALNTLKEKYLNEGNEYCCESKDWAERIIKPSSNFLTIVARFKNELPDRKLCAQILKDKKITIHQSAFITAEIDKLLAKKIEEKEALSNEIKKTAQEIYAPSIEIKNLKKEIKNQRLILGLHKIYTDLYQKIEAYKKQQLNDKPPIEELSKWLESSKIPLEDREAFLKGQLTLDELLLKAKELQDDLPTQTELQKEIKNSNKQLDALLKAPKKETARIYKERIKDNENQIKMIEATLQKILGTNSKNHTNQKIELMRADIKKLQDEIQTTSSKLSAMYLQSDGEELSSEQIIRGAPTRNATLHDFNIEEMLRTASELASTTSAFNLTTENCSTTTMRLLAVGAPKSMRHMFQWTQNSFDNPACNALLNNPQSIYSAATLVAKAQAGDNEAIERVKAEAFLTPNSTYYIRINKLLAIKEKAGILDTIKNNFFSYLRIIPQLLCDLWVTTDTKHAPKSEQEIDKYLNKLNTAVRTQRHSVIKHDHPLLAINSMKEKLQEDPRGVPFFDEKTLQTVRSYILILEAKDAPTIEETQLLKTYSAIINERDERLACVELAVMGNKDQAAHLLSRTDKSPTLTWTQTPSLQIEIMVAKFCDEYQKIQAQKYFQLFRSNSVGSLPKGASNEEKLIIIQKHIIEKPSSASAQAWNNCKFTEEALASAGINTPRQEKELHFKDRYQSQTKNDGPDEVDATTRLSS